MDSQGKRISRALFVIIFIGAIGWLTFRGGNDFVLGLDLNGGSALTYKIETSSLPAESNVEESVTALRDVVERRVNLFGVREPTVTTAFSRLSNEWRLVIELPGVTDVQEAAKMIGETPVLDFRVLKNKDAMNASSGPAMTDFKETELTGRYLKKASLVFDPNTNKPLVDLQFDEKGAELFESLTKAHIGEQVAIFLDGAPISAPVVRQEIKGGKAVISGEFSIEEARTLVGRLNSGALPVPITLSGTTVVGPSLGSSAVDAGMKASIFGFLFVALFMIIWYRVPGIAAALALVAYSVMMLALFKLIPVTLTAAGIAGFIISVGLAVDANVLVFERMKEELRAGKSLRDAVEAGFLRAWTSIRDSHIAAILVSVILFWFGTSIVKGFAFTFFLGAVLSLISAQLITRVFIRALASKSTGKLARFFFSSGLSLK
jgi:protein-export membrane protein SecD